MDFNIDISKSLGEELQEFGGHLECMTCHHKEPLGNVGQKLKSGWPKCCGYTMRWITQSQLSQHTIPGGMPEAQDHGAPSPGRDGIPSLE